MKKITSIIAAITISSFSIIFAQSPGGVAAGSSNQLWLDAFQLGATNGQAVQNWTDFSIGGNTASQATGSRRPIYRTNGINGMPAIDFDGADDYMETSANPSALDGNQSTHFLVYETSSLNAGNNTCFNMDFDQGSNLLYTFATPTYVGSYIKNSSSSAKFFTHGPVTTNHIVSYLWDGLVGTYQGFLNGVTKAPTTNALNAATGHNRARIGAFNTNYKFNGNIAEIIYYTSILNAAERNIVENYLAAKYQIAIAGDMYTHETTHRYDVVGIGQEASGNNLSASGTSNLTLSAATMNNGDYVLVGHDNAGYASNTTDVPSGYNRYNQVWRSTLTNYAGTVDIAFDVSSLGLGADTSYKLLVDADGVFAIGATEYNGVFAGGIVTFTGVTLTSTSYFTLANADFAIVSTGVTNDWHLPTTWTCGCIPTLGSDVTILTGHNVFINGQNAQVGSLIITGSLSFNSNDTLQVNGDVTNNNTVNSGTGTFNFTGSSAQSISGNLPMYNLILNNPLGLTINNSASVQGWLDIVNGTLNTNNSFTLLSNASGTAAYYRPATGEINGDITVERFLNEGESWYLLAPVVSGGDLEDWNQEFEMQGFTGTEWPGGFSSVYYFDQNNIVSNYNQGYMIPNSTFDIINPQVGYEIYVGNDTKATGARTIDITGTPVLGNVTYNCPHIVKLNSPADDGWNLITNPYPTPVKFGWTVKTGNFDKAYVKRNTGAYQAINNQWVLGSGEAFWVHSNPGGSTVTFQSLMAGYEKDITDTYNYRTTANNEPLVTTIKLGYTHNNTTEYDIAYVGFDANATDNKDNELDAYKLNNIFQQKPNLSTINNGYRLERNVLSMNTASIIPINIKTDLPNNTLNSYTLAFDDIAALLKNNKVLTFEDTELNVNFKLTEDTVYSFTMYDTVTTNRFLLHVSSPLVTEQNNVTCFGATNGSLIANGFVNDAKNYVWKDGFNNVIATSVNKNGADTLKNLSPGIYTVEVTNNVTSESVMNTLEITEPQDIRASFLTLTNNLDGEITSSITVDTVNVPKGVEVFFQNNSENTTVFNWNFGDLTTSSLESPGHIYFNTGVYKVELTSSNGACSKSSVQYVNVETALSIDDIESNLDFQLVNVSNGFDLILNNANHSNLSIVINNSLGQEVLSKNLKVNSNYRERIQLEDAQGIYYVTLKSNKTSITKKIVLTKN
ncbi:MAG: T9SS type A sorting domain-containing protein [Vicingaceae bacterium]|nr:T9SS type A sorting domain-containing protein [Vicingaceae bacterium]